MKVVKWLLWVVLFLVVVAAGGAIFLVTSVDPNSLKPQISRKVEAMTGRRLSLDGDLAWQFYPWLGVSVNDFALSNREGFTPENMLEAGRADVQIQLLPLLQKQLEIGKIDLQSPTINLAIDAQGRNNWEDLSGAQTNTASEPEQAAGAMLGGLVIQGVDIHEGRISWNDQAANQQYQLSDFNLTTGQIEPGVPVDVELQTALSSNVLPADLVLQLETSVSLSEAMDSVALAGLNAELGMDKLLAKLALNSLNFSISDSQLNASDLKLEISDEQIAGAANVDAIGFALQSGLLDINRLTGQVSYAELNAKVAAETLAYALESNLATVKKIVYSGSYEPYPFSGQLGDVQYEVDGNRLQVGSYNAVSEYNDLPVTASGTQLQADITHETLNVPALSVSLGEANIEAQLRIEQLLGELQASGQVASNSFNPRPLLTVFAPDLLAQMPEQALQSLALETDFKGGLSEVALDRLSLKLDQSTLTGNASIADFAKPAYRFDLQLDQIDVDQYLSADNQAAAEEAGPAATIALPFAELKGLDAQGQIAIGDFRIMDIRSRDVLVKVDAAANRIEVAPLKASIYGGQTDNTLVYDISADKPAVKLDSQLSKLDIGSFLRAMQITDRFDGSGDVSTNVSSRGLQIDEAIANLNGAIKIALKDGAIHGVNLQQSLIKAEAAINSLAGKDLKLGANLGDKTEFSELGSDIDIKQGVLHFSNIDLKAPAIRVSGGGTVDLNTAQLDLKLGVAVVKSFEGQGGASLDKLKGFTIPMKITGSLESPSVLPDLSKLLQAEAERKLSEKYLGGKKLSGESFDDALKEKLNQKLSRELGVPVAPAAGEKSVPAEAEAEPAQPAAEPAAPAEQTPGKPEQPQKIEDQLKEQLKNKLMKGLFGG